MARLIDAGPGCPTPTPLRGKSGAAARGLVYDDAVKAETQMARRLCSKHGWPVIDVTRKSVEETAASILTLYGEFRETRS